MVELKHEIFIEESNDSVWQELNQFGDVYQHNPNVAISRLIHNESAKVGSVRECTLYNQQKVYETITHWQPNESFIISLKDEPSWPMTAMTIEITTKPSGNHHCQIKMITRYKPKFGLFGYLVFGFLLRPVMKKGGSDYLKGLKAKVETGNWVNKGGKLIDEKKYQEEHANALASETP